MELKLKRNHYFFPALNHFANDQKNSQNPPPKKRIPGFFWLLLAPSSSSCCILLKWKKPDLCDRMPQDRVACFEAQPCSDAVNYLQKKDLPHREGLQPQHKTQRPWPKRKEFGIRGHGDDTMDSRTCAKTDWKKTRLSLRHSLLGEAELETLALARGAG